MKRFVIVGLGSFGRSVAVALHGQGHEVIAVDPDPRAVDAVTRHVTRAVVGDGRSKETLDRLGADGSDAGIVSTGDDLAASILATLALKDLGVARVYCKVTSDDHRRVMTRVGADETIFPEQESGATLAVRLASGDVFSYFSLGTDYSVQEIRAPRAWAGRSLRDVGVRQRYNLVAVAVHYVGADVFEVPPDPDVPLPPTCTLLLAGRNKDLAKLGTGE